MEIKKWINKNIGDEIRFCIALLSGLQYDIRESNKKLRPFKVLCIEYIKKSYSDLLYSLIDLLHGLVNWQRYDFLQQMTY